MAQQNRFARLDGGEIRSYTKGIQMVQEMFDSVMMDFTGTKKRMTPTLMREFLACCLENRMLLREDRGGFIRYNRTREEFEYFEPKE